MNMMGICGDNCSYCPRYVATQKGGGDELVKVKELWVRLGLRSPNFPAEDLSCHGCLPENNCAYSELRQCVRQRNIENCGSCEEYPCERINIAFDKSENLKSRAGRVCTQEEMELLQKSFFSKKEYFNRLHREFNRKG
jgi:hypothetical protein